MNMFMWKSKIKSKSSLLTRRDFLKLAAVGTGALAFRSLPNLGLSEFPQSEKLGRVAVGKVDVFSRPDTNSQILNALYEDNVMSWIREVVGSMPGRTNQRFVETPNGFIWGGQVQPVWNQPNVPIENLPMTSLGLGMWVEVTVPYVDLVLDNPPARAPWLQYQLSINIPPRFYI